MGNQVFLWPLCNAMDMVVILMIMQGGWIIVSEGLPQSFDAMSANYCSSIFTPRLPGCVQDVSPRENAAHAKQNWLMA